MCLTIISIDLLPGYGYSGYIWKFKKGEKRRLAAASRLPGSIVCLVKFGSKHPHKILRSFNSYYYHIYSMHATLIEILPRFVKKEKEKPPPPHIYLLQN